MTYDPITGTFGFDRAVIELRNGNSVRRKEWGEFRLLRMHGGYIEMVYVTEPPLPWFPLQADLLATDWEMVYA